MATERNFDLDKLAADAKEAAAKTSFRRSPDTKILGGVCGGIAEKYDFDPTWVRIVAAIAITTSNAIGIVVYLMAWYLFPLRGEEPAA